MKYQSIEILEDPQGYTKIRKILGSMVAGRNKSIQLTQGERRFLRDILCHWDGIPTADRVRLTVDGAENKFNFGLEEDEE